MVDARENLKLVHVLRHSYRPSEELQASLEKLIQPGRSRPRFLIKSLSAIAIDRVEKGLYKFDLPIRESEQAFRQYRESIELGSNLGIKLGAGALQLLMVSQNRNQFKETQRTTGILLPDGYQFTDKKASKRFDMFVRIDKSQAIEPEELKEPLKDLYDRLDDPTDRSMYVIPDTVQGRDEVRWVPVSAESIYE